MLGTQVSRLTGSFLPELAFDSKKSAIPNEGGKGRQNSQSVSAMNEGGSQKSTLGGKRIWNAQKQHEGGSINEAPRRSDKADGGETGRKESMETSRWQAKSRYKML